MAERERAIYGFTDAESRAAGLASMAKHRRALSQAGNRCEVKNCSKKAVATRPIGFDMILAFCRSHADAWDRLESSP
jgi:hypothetical protein